MPKYKPTAENTDELHYQYQRMHERAVSSVAIRIHHVLAEQWKPLSEAGWSDDDVRVILDQAVLQCVSKP